MIENGYIDIIINCKEVITRLKLDDHKQIKLTTKSEEVFDDFGIGIMDLGFKQTREYYSLEIGFHHWHYRPYGSRNKIEFREFLIDEYFELKKKEKVNKIKE